MDSRSKLLALDRQTMTFSPSAHQTLHVLENTQLGKFPLAAERALMRTDPWR